MLHLLYFKIDQTTSHVRYNKERKWNGNRIAFLLSSPLRLSVIPLVAPGFHFSSTKEADVFRTALCHSSIAAI